ncbi:MAG: ADP-glyceromanno-heptose 6-epimerase [Acidiferrobacterales bacterium]|nr:ADP-glyceromanno-heptose 6-epimerase [Acidiferrobacterales bacterium]
MYVVTGGLGFIGSNVVRALNKRGIREVLVVDELPAGERSGNIADCQITDLADRRDFLKALSAGQFARKLKTIFHKGACSDTMEKDRGYMMENNYEYSKSLLRFCQQEKIPFIYASSAAVYGAKRVFRETPEHDAPTNIYAYSKALFDQDVRPILPNRTAQIVGLRYFNVYGPGEEYKGSTASVAFHFFNQYCSTSRVRLFRGSGGYGDGEQQRDFVSVEDAVAVNLFFTDHPDRCGIFNVGTGHARSFNDMAVAVINSIRGFEGKSSQSLEQLQSEGTIEYIDFPSGLAEQYQSFTQADISALRSVGFERRFLSLEQGVQRYVETLVRDRAREAG